MTQVNRLSKNTRSAWNAPHKRSDAQDDMDGVPHVSMDYGFLGERDSEEQVSDDVGNAGSEERDVAKKLGHNGVTLRCDSELAVDALARGIGQKNRSRETASWRKPVQRDHRTCSGARCQPGQNTGSCARASHREQNPA